MAIDKTKVAQNAQKLIQKGQLDKAIKEYQLLVEADPKDIRSLLKIAELYGKLNNKAEAIKTFRRVAEQYNKSGFYTKAVAVLRQAIEADPKQIDLYTQLADLYQKLGLNKDAILQLNNAARLLQDEGRHTQALEILQKMRDLDPEEPSVQARYGEALFNAGQREQAIQIFRTLISSLKISNNNDDLIRFCERILTINPDDIEALKDLSRAYVKVGLANKALLKLKALFDRNVLDAELYDLLDRCYQILGKEDKAVHAQVEKAKYLLSQGKAEDARRAYETVLERDPNNADAISYLRPSRRTMPPAAAKPAQAAAPAQQPASKPAAGAPPSKLTPTGPTTASKQLSKFLTEADVYLKYGLRDKALEQLENVLQHDPNNIAARRKLVDIYSEENPQKAAFHLRNLADVSESLGEIEQAQVYRGRANELDPQDGESATAAPAEPESGFLDEDSVGADETEIAIDSGEGLEADVEVGGEEETAEAEGDADFLGGDEMAGDFLDDGDEAAAEPRSDVIDIEGGGPNLSEELDEAEFYIQQGIFNEAQEIFNRILAQHPGHAAATERLAWVEAQMEAAKPAAKPAAAKPAAAQPAPPAPKAEDENMFDLAAELEEELDFGEEAQASAESEEPPSFEDIFSQFKKGVERELKDDAGAHYDLGIAYKEMGLVADAVGEFEIAMKSEARMVESCNMMAICYQELGQNDKAVECFRRALEAPNCPPEASLNMNYELACLFETMDDVRNAALHFKKVIDNDKTYRDVGERIRALKARVQSGKAYA